MKTYSLLITDDNYERFIDHILLCLKEYEIKQLNDDVEDRRVGRYYVVRFCKPSRRLTVLTRHSSPYGFKVVNRVLKFAAALFRLPLLEEP